MTSAPAVTLRPAASRDWPLLRGWLTRPDIEAWWGPHSATEPGIRIAMQGGGLCRIVEIDGAPVGYAQAVDAMLWGTALPDGLPAGTWDIDVFIAAEQHRGQGAGSAALTALVDEVFATTLAVAVSIFVAVRNERAVRAYEKAGFRWVAIANDPAQGPEWVMLRERPAR
jgi:RimJ/RimL family protein N-acetyltransferase